MYWELNSFHGARHVAILEVEAESQETALNFPPMVEVLREVTHEYEYDSHAISRRIAQHAAKDEMHAIRTPAAHAGLQVSSSR